MKKKKKYYSPATPRKGCLMRRHLFFLALENSIYPDYVTEKLYEPLSVGGSMPNLEENVDGNSQGPIPIYLGAPNVADLAPADHSLINAADFPTVSHLTSYLRCLSRNESLVRHYRSWRKRVGRRTKTKWGAKEGTEGGNGRGAATNDPENHDTTPSFTELASAAPLCAIAERIYDDRQAATRLGSAHSKPLSKRRANPPPPTVLRRGCGWVTGSKRSGAEIGSGAGSSACDYSQFLTDQSPLPCGG